jgi:hypothetical protein
MTPTPTPPTNEEDCVYCDMPVHAAVEQLRKLITARTPHVICCGCRKAMGIEVTAQLNRMAHAPSRKWD